MSKYAIVKDGKVVNVIVADAGFTIDGVMLVENDGTAQIGGGWDGEAFLPAPEAAASTDPADYPLSQAQFQALVTYLGKDAEIRTAIDAISDPLQRAWALSRYENATSYVYSDAMLQQIREDIGMSEADLSEAWMQAKDLRSE